MVGGMTVLNDDRVGTTIPHMELAKAYIPIQGWTGQLFDLARALEVGTLFPELWRPYPNTGGDR